MRTLAVFVLSALLAGCGWMGGGPTCDDPDKVLAGSGEASLTCNDFEIVATYVEVVAGRALSEGDRRQLARGLVRRFKRDPVGTRTQVASAKGATDHVIPLRGLEAAEARSTLAYHAVTGQGALAGRKDDVDDVVGRAVAVWASDPDEELALTEVDIEGWILYASLCREVQDASPLRISVADRVVIYHDMEQRFASLPRRGQIAMAAIGPFWPEVKDRWAMATYEEQQLWISRAPLPPPMVSTSKAYLAAIFEGDVEEHARILHGSLGPFRLAVFR